MVLYGFFLSVVFIHVTLFKMEIENAIRNYEDQHEILMRQNDYIMDELNVSFDMGNIIIENQQIIGHMVLWNCITIVFLLFILVVVLFYLDQVMQRQKDEEEIQEGAYVIMGA